MVVPMVGIIKFFGVLSIIVGVVLILVSFGTILFLPTLMPLGASALLGGALLFAFARVVELLEELNKKLIPIHSIAVALEKKYNPSSSDSPIADPQSNPPVRLRTETHFGRRVDFLSDGSVIGETDGGVYSYRTFEDWRKYIGK